MRYYIYIVFRIIFGLSVYLRTNRGGTLITEVGHRGLDIDLPIDSNLRVQRFGTHLAGRIDQKHACLDSDIAASALKRIGHNLAVF